MFHKVVTLIQNIIANTHTHKQSYKNPPPQKKNTSKHPHNIHIHSNKKSTQVFTKIVIFFTLLFSVLWENDIAYKRVHKKKTNTLKNNISFMMETNRSKK